jgi:hypothetical protein
MTSRDELIEVAWTALKVHDANAVEGVTTADDIGAIVDAVEPIIRTEAYARAEREVLEWCCTDTKAALRAKVAELPHDESCQVDNIIVIEPEPECTCLRGDILALLDGEASDE